MLMQLSAEEVAQRGDEIYEQNVRPFVEAQAGKVAAVDVYTGAYAVGADALTASHSLHAQHPDAEIWCVRIGSRFLHRMGQRP